MKVWESDREVIYEPRALVHHYEGASSSQKSSVFDLLIRNHMLFAERWRDSLLCYQSERPKNIVKARIAAGAKAPKYLFVVDEIGVGFVLGEVAKMRRESDAYFALTCIYTGADAGAGSLAYDLGVDVEVRALVSMSEEEALAYCEASDLIVLAATQSARFVAAVSQQYSAKIAGFSSPSNL